MKEVFDRSLFPEKYPPCYEKKGKSAYYRQDYLTFYRGAYAHKPAPPDALLYSQMISEYRAIFPSCHVRLSQCFLDIQQVVDGNLLFRSGNRMFLAEPGEFVLLHKGEDHCFLPGPAGYCMIRSVLIFGPLVNDAVRNSSFHGESVLRLADPSRFESCFSELRKTMNDTTGENRDDRISSLCFDILQILNTREKILRYPPRLKNLLEFIREKDGNLSLTELAEKAGCSIPTLTALFRKNLNKTPHKYLICWKMGRALDMLFSGQRSIKEIAVRCGYENPLNFSTEFKKHYGSSPRNYLREYRVITEQSPSAGQKSQ